MNALVTGGGGFLGLEIVRRLRARGDTVTVLARGDYPELATLGARLVRGDVADAAAVLAAAAGADIVFHVAAKAGVWGKQADFERSNVTGTENVLFACRAHGIPRLVYTSSPSVVFDGTDHIDVSEVPYPTRYENHYAETKARAEKLVLAANGPALATIALRPHLIWGPRDPHILPRLFARARAGRLRIVGTGTNQVSVTYVDNGAAAHLQAADALSPGAPCAGRAYFVNDPVAVSVWPWLNALFGRLGIAPVTRRVSVGVARAVGVVAEAVWSLFGLAGDPPMTRFVAAQLGTSHSYDVGPAVRDFGYTPEVGPEEALDRTAAWWKDHLPPA
ncbi:MAG: NAD-dependent epimerase/dehydratase family protein [Pseudomonadota bacterium]|nr:NAD-dependent epimerase/dehydratase family protein [Pseudomonadota bacterium]